MIEQEDDNFHKVENKPQQETTASQSAEGTSRLDEATTTDGTTNDDLERLEHDDDESLNERSFEVIHPASVTEIKMTSINDDQAGQKSQQAAGGTIEDSNSKPRSNSDSRKSSFSSRIRNSGSFLNKLQAAGDEHDSSNNISSSIASAFSSLSSTFTSNFTLNSPPTSQEVANTNNLSIETASTSTRLSQITETKEDIFNRRALIERQNLIALTKLIVKDLISSSLMVSRTLDERQTTVHLNNYFTLIDRVLKHGLKQNLLTSSSSSLWNALDSLPKYLRESTLMSESVRSLANTKTPDGKIKAWMRLAMMQKKLPEYFSELLANKNVLLKDIYHDWAFMLNDEAHVFAGLIIGVNVIDCNFFVKDDNFDVMNDIISLSPYLKNANCYDEEADDDATMLKGGNNEKHDLKAILDQKNYLEEFNKRLQANISNLQAKIKSLEDQNSRLEMEAKVSEARILKYQSKQGDQSLASSGDKQVSSSITDAIKSFINTSDNVHSKPITGSSSSRASSTPPENSSRNLQLEENQLKADQQKQLSSEENQAVSQSESLLKDTAANTEAVDGHQEVQQHVMEELELARRKISEQERELVSIKERTSILESSYKTSLEKIKVMERDIDVQTSINSDKETTIKMYERDIREKQALVESLRNSLNDSKKLQAEMSAKLADTSAKLKDRIKSVGNLQTSLDKWKLENKTLATKLQEKQAALKSFSDQHKEALKTIEDLKKYNEKINDELRKERESGHSSSATVEAQITQINELKEKVASLESELGNVKPFKNQTEELARRCKEYELSLEEIGHQLRESRLEIESLKENSAVFLDSQWTDSKQVKACTLCQQLFSVTRRKHHCRLCGNVFCQPCSDNKMELASSAKPVRVCDTCHAFLLAKFVKSST